MYHLLNFRMELHAHQGEAKEATIAETLKSLVTSKTELRKKEQNVRQLSKQVAQADMEKKKIAHKLQDAETSLKTFSR